MMRTIKQVRPEFGLQGLVRPSVYNFHFDLSTLARQCEIVCENLKDLINATKAPGRSKYFRLNTGRTAKIPVPIERRLEQAIWIASKNDSRAIQLGDICKTIHTYQFPLWRHKGDLSTVDVKGLNKGWGKSCIDLVGTDANGFPVVLELKKGDRSSSNPLHMVVEAALYGVAILQMWPDILPEWKHAFDRYAPPVPLQTCHLIGVAPVEYWRHWLNDKSQRNLWGPLRMLSLKLAEGRLPVSFASFAHGKLDKGLPEIRDLRPISLPDE